MRFIKIGILVFMLVAIAGIIALVAQQPGAPNMQEIQKKTQEDHQNMMNQLGIKKLRPGPSGNESAPDHANYDESLANPFPDLPRLLMCQDGAAVTTREDWIKRR